MIAICDRTIRHLAAAAFLALAVLLGLALARAAINPSAIQWTASDPHVFITSLYHGVLGRAPESPMVVAQWARQISADPNSRMRVFNQFVGSPSFDRRIPAASPARTICGQTNARNR
ncbi:MAG: DUF4214 domain-containing protein [Pseudorhodoplanes sp.]|nr:DUF4214 domain-containing protein [Pseudorhodoplanes sp.]